MEIILKAKNELKMYRDGDTLIGCIFNVSEDVRITLERLIVGTYVIRYWLGCNNGYLSYYCDSLIIRDTATDTIIGKWGE